MGDRDEVGREVVDRQTPEVEPLAPPDDRGRHLVRLGGGEHEPHARRGFLEDLQQRVECLARQALRLVDDVDLLATLHRRRRRLLAKLARVFDAAVAGGVDLDDVEVGAVAYRDALRARAARLGRRPLLAVDHLRQDASGRRLARATRPAEQERVVQAALTDRAGERTHDVVLPEHLGGRLRPVPAGTGPGAASRPPRASYPPRRPFPAGAPAPSAITPPAGGRKVAVHPPSTTDDSVATWNGSSSQASLRHPPASAYGCFLPDLTGFAGRCRAGPDLQRSVPRAAPDLPGLGRGFSPAEADRGYRAPLAPRLARPRGSIRGGSDERRRAMDDVVRAGLWGFLAASALPLGALVAMRFTLSTRTVGAIMAFGAGTLITAVTFELVDQAFERADLWPVVLGLGLGAASFTVGDAILVQLRWSTTSWTEHRGGRRAGRRRPADRARCRARRRPGVARARHLARDAAAR